MTYGFARSALVLVHNEQMNNNVPLGLAGRLGALQDPPQFYRSRFKHTAVQ